MPTRKLTVAVALLIGVALPAHAQWRSDQGTTVRAGMFGGVALCETCESDHRAGFGWFYGVRFPGWQRTSIGFEHLVMHRSAATGSSANYTLIEGGWRPMPLRPLMITSGLGFGHVEGQRTVRYAGGEYVERKRSSGPAVKLGIEYEAQLARRIAIVPFASWYFNGWLKDGMTNPALATAGVGIRIP